MGTKGKSFKRTGLTLIELLLIIGILGVLVGIIWIVSAEVQRRMAEVQCMKQMKQIYLALQIYRADYGDFPRWPHFVEALYPHYIKDRRLFFCPNDRERFDLLKKEKENNPNDPKINFLWRYLTSYSYYYGFPSPTDRLRKIGGRSFQEAYAERGGDIPLLICSHHKTCQGCLPLIFLVTRMNGKTDRVLITKEEFAWNQL